MDTLSYKTISANKSTIHKEWILIDAENEVVGRVASVVAKILRGKHKPSFTPHVDGGDYVVIINADKVRFTGKKMDQKTYIRYTGYPGGQRSATPRDLMDKAPQRILENAVKGMLPKNRLGRSIIKNLHVYAGTEHKHQAQQPKEIKLTSIK
ncbi:MAG: 50S ribosomal protein L13 [Hyphomicrobiales bacterium]